MDSSWQRRNSSTAGNRLADNEPQVRHFNHSNDVGVKVGDLSPGDHPYGWHHVVLTHDESTSTRTFYIDEVQAGSFATDDLNVEWNLAAGMIVGSNIEDSLGLRQLFGGLMDDVAVFDHPLSAELDGDNVIGGEVHTLMTQGGAVFIPEPATMVLFVIGALGLALKTRKIT